MINSFQSFQIITKQKGMSWIFLILGVLFHQSGVPAFKNRLCGARFSELEAEGLVNGKKGIRYNLFTGTIFDLNSGKWSKVCLCLLQDFFTISLNVSSSIIVTLSFSAFANVNL